MEKYNSNLSTKETEEELYFAGNKVRQTKATNQVR